MEANILRQWSCDTYVAQRDATATGGMIFGKNSDRPAGEVQPLRLVPARQKDDKLQLAYVSIPDESAYAHLGAAPFWCWGYEFGINEHDVVIGNEAQFTRSWAEAVQQSRDGKPPACGIIGMELVRLGLERGSSARGALDIMTALLERYGQWGSGLFGKGPAEGAYDNSYLIADRDDAWVLETSGREWVARQIKSGIYSISNEPSIRSEYDLCSTNLLATARARGWISPEATFDYAVSHADPGTPLQVSHMRQRRSQSLLEAARARGGVGLENAKAVLRDHFEGSFLNGPYFNAARPDFLTLCMHEHTAGFTWGNTAGSVIVDMGKDADDLTVVWWTPLPPCIGAYIPIFLPAPEIPEELQMPVPDHRVRPPEDYRQPPFNRASYWWRFQNLLDAVKGDSSGTYFTERRISVRAHFDRLEGNWNDEVNNLRRAWKTADGEKRSDIACELGALTARAVRDVNAAVDGFLLEYAPKGRNEPMDPRWANGIA